MVILHVALMLSCRIFFFYCWSLLCRNSLTWVDSPVPESASAHIYIEDCWMAENDLPDVFIYLADSFCLFLEASSYSQVTALGKSYCYCSYYRSAAKISKCNSSLNGNWKLFTELRQQRKQLVFFKWSQYLLCDAGTQALYYNTINSQQLGVCLSADANHSNSPALLGPQSVFHLSFPTWRKTQNEWYTARNQSPCGTTHVLCCFGIVCVSLYILRFRSFMKVL